MKQTVKILLGLLVIVSLASCDRSQANVQTLISDDCGASWTLIPTGSIVPKRIGPCALKTTLPTSPMGGESKFKCSFTKALVDIALVYEYEIIDPVKFITSAPYLAKTNADPDDVSANNSRFESAENSIIDKRVKEVAQEMLRDADIVVFDQSEFETALETKINEMMMNDRGIKLNYISFVPMPDEQTNQAIDVATALRIYESVGIREEGVSIITARAGAAKIEINSGGLVGNSAPEQK